MALKWSTIVGGLRAAGLPLACLVAVLVAGIAVVVLSHTVGGSDEPPAAPAFSKPADPAYTALDVKQKNGDTLTLIKQLGETAVQQEFVPQSGLAVERLKPITAADVQPGDWVTVVGIADDVKNFSVHFIVVFPAGTTTPADGVARSKGGFLGHEIARNALDRPILGGAVEKVQGKDVILKGPLGPITVAFGPEAKVRAFRVEPSAAGAIGEGDRLAGVFNGTSTASVLVLPPEGGF